MKRCKAGTPTWDRFWSKVKKSDRIKCHRLSLMLMGVEIPPGMFVDHICRNRKCVRPEHLRVVTPKTNSLENSIGPIAVNARKTKCKRGHPFVEGNIRYMKTKYGGVGRCCIICHRAGSIESYHRRIREGTFKRSPRGAQK